MFLDFFKLLQEDKDNFVYSPVSLATAFAILYEGADGEAKEELKNIFGFNDGEDVVKWFKELSVRINSLDETELSLLNSFWLVSENKLKEAFGTYIEEHCDKVVLGELDLKKVRDGVNAFSNKATNGKIPTIIDFDLTEGTRFVITNSIYFKSVWKQPFKPCDKKISFTNLSGEQSEVDMVKAYILEERVFSSDFMFGGIDVVSIPYKNGVTYMSFLVPRKEYKNDNMFCALKALINGTFSNWAHTANINITMPEFKLETYVDSENMNGYMKALGATSMYNHTLYPLKNIYEEEPLMVDKVLHKAIVEVNRNGTEAAATTAITGISSCSAPALPEELDITLNKPFVFVLHTYNGVPLMIGRVTNL